MDDFEVRQALALIKDRVKEIKKDEDWKVNIAKEWNDAADEAGVAAEESGQYRQKDDDNKSVVSYSKDCYQCVNAKCREWQVKYV